jgi:pyridoxamine-phosphate oxidase
MAQLAAWLKEAEAAGNPLPEAMCLSTVGEDGGPASRMVLLKGLQPEGLDFFTCLKSAKAAHLAADPRACMDFWWSSLHRQVVVGGQVEPLRRKKVERYFQSRPRGSQVAATASRQSHESSGRQDLEERCREIEARFEGVPIPCPDHWGGFRLVPNRFEFWQGREDRLHDRFAYLPSEEAGYWRIQRLDP